ncbi:hypothetical protein LINGRAHAP2_LOCUS29890 [Linum grandiflorum]
MVALNGKVHRQLAKVYHHSGCFVSLLVLVCPSVHTIDRKMKRSILENCSGNNPTSGRKLPKDKDESRSDMGEDQLYELQALQMPYSTSLRWPLVARGSVRLIRLISSSGYRLAEGVDFESLADLIVSTSTLSNPFNLRHSEVQRESDTRSKSGSGFTRPEANARFKFRSLRAIREYSEDLGGVSWYLSRRII